MSVAYLEDIDSLMYHIFSWEESVIAFYLLSNGSNNTKKEESKSSFNDVKGGIQPCSMLHKSCGPLT